MGQQPGRAFATGAAADPPAGEDIAEIALGERFTGQARRAQQQDQEPEGAAGLEA
jgi:hypothetical protein